MSLRWNSVLSALLRSGVVTWVLVITGAAGLIFEPVSRRLGAWMPYLLLVAGALLFALSHLLREPSAPEFLSALPDPWEDKRPR